MPSVPVQFRGDSFQGIRHEALLVRMPQFGNAVCKRVEPVVKAACGKDRRFNASYHHALACEFYKVRPKKSDLLPHKTDVEMCQYDAAHKDYVYTEKWVTFLIEEMKKPGQYQKL